MKHLLLILLTAFSCSSSYAQGGLYGKKNILEVQATGYIPLFQRAFLYDNYGNGVKYDAENDDFNSQVSKFNYGFRAQYLHCIGIQQSLGLMVGMDFWKAPGLTLYDDWNNVWYQAHEQLSMRTLTIVPTFEIASAYSKTPIGLFHQIGVGVTSTKVVDKEYARTQGEPFTIDDPIYEYQGYNLNYWGIQGMYAMKMRTPIGKRILLNYGTRYTFDLNLVNDTFNWVGLHNLLNIISLEAGISVAL